MNDDEFVLGHSEYQKIYEDLPLLRGVVGWLRRNGADPHALVVQAMTELFRRGRSLPKEHRVRYAEKVIIGAFLARWSAKHRGKSILDIVNDHELSEREFIPFELALIAASDERAFNRVAPQFVRRRMIDRLGITIGTGEDFEGFVSSNTHQLAERFLKNFDSTRADAAFKAVAYIQKTAVSSYLQRRTRPIRTDAPNLDDYLQKSTRISPRTILAVKLAYLPSRLTSEERAALNDDYGFAGPYVRTLPIKKIAEYLGYKNPAALSRKLYRVREWCRRSAPLVDGTSDEVGFE